MRLHENEKVIFQATLHWSNFLVPGIIAGFFYLAGFGALSSNTPGASGNLFVFGTIPILLAWASQKSKKFVITNQRVYIEQGILVKSKLDITLKKINDVTTSQGLTQRLLGSGNVQILVGNDRPTLLKGIENPDVFRETIFGLISK